MSYFTFARLCCLCVDSEALSTGCLHWVLGRIQHHLDMITSDKKSARAWGKRLHIAMQVKRGARSPMPVDQ